MDSSQLFQQIQEKRSYLCVGLDIDQEKIPAHLRSLKDPVFEFNRQIIDATHRYCVAFKANVAFYEAMGPRGWESLQKTIEYLPKDVFTIADAKRGDIGNTSALYAKTFFDTLNFDSVTVAPYMGKDSVTPFLSYKGKWVILLGHTSNPGSGDFQMLESASTGRKLYEEVIMKGCEWGTPEQMMFVVGATHPEKIESIRRLAREYFFLVPGIGAQGGDLAEVSRRGMNSKCGLLVNSSRAIIYASKENDFAAAAAREAHDVQEEMNRYLDAYL
jgi:orotidine-5'-phosphate decarboxylase